MAASELVYGADGGLARSPSRSALWTIALVGSAAAFAVAAITYRIDAHAPHDRGLSTEEAVTYGIKTTAGVVTSAAIVMVCVFSVFATLSMLIFKQFGVGLAAAILIDATIVRAVLLPATMKLLGDWNWYLPGWLEWLPHLEHGGEVEKVEAQPVPTPSV
jgi:uncharacterized membrane protein YdfJ with MMPL/SSD domain